jgi:release factor glutamine methyltransferase
MSEVLLDALLHAAKGRLATALGLDAREAMLEARVLAQRAWNVERTWLFSHATDALDETHRARFEALLGRRLNGEPIAHILGEREFHGLAFIVTPDVLIPRPETELLVDLALRHMPEHAASKVLDLCSGSGAVAIALAHGRPHARVAAVEISPKALRVARANAQTHAVAVEWLQGDLFAPLAGRRFDLIVGNPPYIAEQDAHLDRGDVRFEPRLALVGGKAGTEVIARIVVASPAHLRAGGALLLEHGFDQGEACRALFKQAGFLDVETWRDLASIERVTAGRRSRG